MNKLLTIGLLFCTVNAAAQTNSFDTTLLMQPVSMSNSFEMIYSKNNPTIQYSYDTEKQIHNYSNNWDLDKDGKKDEVYFVGTGGAHLYFYLRIILKSDHVVRDFPFIESDMPILPTDEDMKRTGYRPDTSNTWLAAFGNNKDSLFIKLDAATFDASKNELKRKGVKTNGVAIGFKNGKVIFKDHDAN